MFLQLPIHLQIQNELVVADLDGARLHSFRTIQRVGNFKAGSDLNVSDRFDKDGHNEKTSIFTIPCFVFRWVDLFL